MEAPGNRLLLEDILNLALSGRASFGQHQKLGTRLKYCEYKRQQRQRLDFFSETEFISVDITCSEFELKIA